MFDPYFASSVLRAQPQSMGDEELTAHVLATIGLAERAQAAVLAAIGEWDARTLWAGDGAVNPGQWLAGRAELSGRDARCLAATARSLHRSTSVSHALADGRLSVGQAKALASVRLRRVEEVFDAHEPLLVEAPDPIRELNQPD